MITAKTFRTDFPPFASVALYPDPVVNLWIGVAGMLMLPTRWGPGSTTAENPASTPLDFAQELFVAHNLALEKTAQDSANRGATPGASKGLITGDHVGSVSRSYDTSGAMEEGAGHWNLTIYGTRLKRLMELFGAGPTQVGVGHDPWGCAFGFGYDGVPWVGPPPFPGQTSFG